jgi:NTP pyrophosphatase (non-canonical NTP hydrolase)
MDFNVYQTATDRTAIYPNAGEGNADAINYAIVGLAGEVGSIQNKWKKYLRGDVPLEEILPLIIEEAGDVLWYWARLCLEAGQSGDMVAQANLQKLIDRKERGVLQGFGSHR